MNDSKKSLALNLTIVIHKESDSRRGSFVVRKSIAFPCAQLLGDHRKGDVNTPPPTEPRLAFEGTCQGDEEAGYGLPLHVSSRGFCG